MDVSASRNIAAFVNADTLAGRYGADLHASDILRELRRFGTVQAAFAYGDWVRQRRLQQEFDAASFRLIAVPRAERTPGGDWLDESAATLVEQAFRISLDALEFALSHPRIDTIAIAGTSPLYAGIASRLRTHGLRVIGIGPDDAVCAGWVRACHRFVYALPMLGHRVPAATFEEGHHRVTRVVAAHPPGSFRPEAPDILHEALIDADPAFDPRNYGCADFDTWFSKYRHILEAPVIPRRADSVVEADGLGRQNAGSVANVARAVLMRALVDASWRGMPMPMARFRDAVQAVAPDFDEKTYGFESFLACLEAFPDLVVIDRNTWQIHANDGVIPLDPPRPGGRNDHPDAQPVERRRKPRDNGATAEVPDHAPAVDDQQTGAPRASQTDDLRSTQAMETP